MKNNYFDMVHNYDILLKSKGEKNQMNLKKSINVCLAENEKSTVWLQEVLGMSQPQFSSMMRRNSAQLSTLEKIANAFGLKISEFIAKGE